ncbi:hypothetical protein [Aurantimonas sp. Leaf443]|uniref:hypothetical protein n=1 Tax=Aurantimonas sp. Leaf443 TaxID=1736378 RepID=UPI000B09EF9C|nr:hypothetical protein [Aurantimonas sp. Leaf443]
MTLTISGRCVSRVTRKAASWTLPLTSLVEGGRFRGRPVLTQRLLNALQVLYEDGTKSTARNAVNKLKYFWEFLDHFEEMAAVLPGDQILRIDDVDWSMLESIWRHFIDWLRNIPEERLNRTTKYQANQMACSVFKAAFDLSVRNGETDKQHLDIYVYFKFLPSTAYDQAEFDFNDAKKALAILAKAWRKIVARIAMARKLAEGGRNPAVGSGHAQNAGRENWGDVKNRLWLIANILPFPRLSRDPSGTRKYRDGMKHQLPMELLITELGSDRNGLTAHSSCLFLRQQELAIAFALVSMKTGMNPDSISQQTLDRWYVDDPMNQGERVTILGPKRDGQSNLKASSSTRKWTDAYQIIKQVVEIQQPLRHRLSELSADENNQELADLASLVWIGLGSDNGIFNYLPRSSTFTSLHAALDGFFLRNGVKNRFGEPMKYRVSQGRDIWGLFVYRRSGFNHILTASALGHSTLTALLHYLAKRTTLIEDRKKLVDLQSVVFRDLEKGMFAPRAYRKGPIETAVTGLHCTKPTQPAPNADPGNPGGRPCRAQGCWTCYNWFASLESLVPLCRIIRDLQGLREELPLAMWETSDFPIMLEIYKHIVSKFHSKHVSAAELAATDIPPIITTAMFISRQRVRRTA